MGRHKNAVPTYRLWRDDRGNWNVTWTHPKTGRTMKRGCGTADEAAARAKMRDIVHEVENPPAPPTYTVGTLLAAYVESRQQHDCSATFVHNFTRTREFFAAYAPEQLKDGAWASYRKWRTGQLVANAASKGKRPVSDATAVRELNGVRGAISWAQRNGYKGLDNVKVHLPNSASKVRHRYLSRAEAERLIKACIEPHTGLFVRISLATGARMSAVLGLKWADVTFPASVQGAGPADFHDSFTMAEYVASGRIRLSDIVTLDLGQGRGNKRRGTGVVSPSNWLLWAALVTAYRSRDNRGVPGLAATSANPACEFVVNFRGKRLGKVDLTDAYRRAGITGCSQHTLKHTCCSWLVQAGQSYENIAKLIGTSARTIEKHYGHLSPKHLATVGDVLSI